MREQTNTTKENAVENASEKAVSASATVKTRKKTSAKKTAIKITKFDKALAEQIITGETDLKKIQEKLRIDEKEFFERAKKLGEAGYITTSETGETRFGIRGFEAFAKQFKKLAPTPRAQPEETPPAQAQQTQSPFVQPAIPPELDPKQTFLPEATAKEKDNVDLSELLKKGAPKPSDSIFIKRQREKSTKVFSRAFESMKASTTASTTGELVEALKKNKPGSKEALIVDGGEACELCKTNFKLAVGNDSNPKHGHCFCGAAYHKDCYESLTDNSGKCVRCGKKLKLELSKQSEDAVKELKEVF
ncbi:hypothetical protein H0N96_01920 [Candidatus Micrarchaeota archaeon]|nr:hypothetical protein [Candidatus Micrarchaeota archaeon]